MGQNTAKQTTSSRRKFKMIADAKVHGQTHSLPTLFDSPGAKAHCCLLLQSQINFLWENQAK
jgi:hypothetical protein